ncbi:MAG: GAF domain-containing protein, partial [Spirulina sp.]
IVRIASTIMPAAYLSGSPWHPLLVALSVKLSIQYGNIAASGFGYISYGNIACNRLQDIETGVKFGRLAIGLVSQLDAKAVKPEILVMEGALILHRQSHLQETLGLLKESYNSALEVGNPDFTGHVAHIICCNAFWCGQPLAPLERETRAYCDGLGRANQLTTANYCCVYWQSILNLLGETEHPGQLSGKALQEAEFLPNAIATRDLYGLCISYLAKLMLCYLFGDIAAARDQAAAIAPYLIVGTGTVSIPVFYFYDSLSALATLTSGAESSEVWQRVERNQTQLQQFWARYAPMNHQHKVDLVEAEKCRVLGQKAEAIDLYDTAIAGAKANEYYQEEALANECAAKFYLEWGKPKIAGIYMQEAYYGYARWGAKAKTDDLEQRYPQLLAPILTQPQPSSTSGGSLASLTRGTRATKTTGTRAMFDLASLMKASRILSEAIDLDRAITNLMQVVLENAGAETVALMHLQGETLILEAKTTHGIPKNFDPLPVEESPDLPHSMINAVKRTCQSLVLDNASENATYAGDAYIQKHRPRSILCLPLLDRGQLVAILYLENNRVVGAFTRDRVELLEILCSQAAISLKNSRLYAESKNYSQQLEAAIEQLETTQAKILQDERVLQAQVQASIELSQSPLLDRDDIEPALQEITAVTARVLGVERASIWVFDEERTKIQCVDLFELTPQKHSRGWEVAVVDYPSYFAAIATEPILAIDEARVNPATRALTEGYLVPLNIYSILDSGFELDGCVAGVICCEQTGTYRHWTQAEQNFARSVANFIALVLESNRRKQHARELEQTQLQLVQNEKMATLGNLVAGVAHEINNPLGFIGGNVQAIQDYFTDLFAIVEGYRQELPHPSPELAEEIEELDLDFMMEDLPKTIASMQKGVDRIGKISTSLRTFSRADTDAKTAFNLHEGIDSTLLILKYRLKANEHRPAIEVIKDYGDIPEIKCYPGQLNQVFMNLFANAIDALEESNAGKSFAEIETHANCLTIQTELSPEGRSIIVQISDNGKGMREDVKARIFEQGFTTKGVGKGTGLGMAIARQIVEEKHGGLIRCVSELGWGTKFILNLPFS